MIGSILQGSFDLYRRFFKYFVSTAAVVFVVLDLVAGLADAASWRGGGIAALWGFVSALVSFVGSFWVQGALVEAVQDVRDGRADLDVGQLYRRAQPRLGVLLLAGLLAGLGIAIGFLLFIIPGFYLLTQWVLIVPVIVLEKKAAFDAFGRSHQLVRGNGWNAFGLILLTVLVSAVAQSILVALFSWLPRFASVWIGGLIAHSLVVPWVAIAWTLLYYRLVELRQPLQAPAGPTVPPPPTTPPIPVG